MTVTVNKTQTTTFDALHFYITDLKPLNVKGSTSSVTLTHWKRNKGMWLLINFYLKILESITQLIPKAIIIVNKPDSIHYPQV